MTANGYILPTVRTGEHIVYELDTRGTIEFDQNISQEGLKFLSIAKKWSLMRKLTRKNDWFMNHLTKDGYDPDELLLMLNMISKFGPNSITFKTNMRLRQDAFRQAARGLDVMSNLSVLGENLSVNYGYMQFRLGENEIRRVRYEEGRWMVTTGWIMPVWTNKSFPVS